MVRYDPDENVNLTRKLDPYPEFGDFLRDPLTLEEVRQGNIDDSHEAYDDLSPFTYHELFSDPRLEEADALKIDEAALEDMQSIIWENRPSRALRPRGHFFESGYNKSTSNIVEDPATGTPMIEEILQARENPYEDSSYVREDIDGFGEDLPLIGGYFQGRHKSRSDTFYNMAAARVNQMIGEVEINVEQVH